MRKSWKRRRSPSFTRKIHGEPLNGSVGKNQRFIKDDKKLTLGLLLGALIMAAIITVQFLLGDKIKTSENIRKYTGMATLVIVPCDEGFSKGSFSRKRPAAKE